MTVCISKILLIQNFLKSHQLKNFYYKDISWIDDIEISHFQNDIFIGSIHILISQHLKLLITISQICEFHISLNNDTIIQSKSLGLENGYEVFIKIQDIINYSQQIRDQLEQLNSKLSLMFDIIENVKKIIEE